MRSLSPDKSELLTGPIGKYIFRLATPMIIAFFFVTSYQYADRYFVSRIGDLATAAIGMAFIIQMMIIALGVGIGSGVNSFIARNLGAGRRETAENASLHALAIALLTGIVIAGIGLLLQRPLFSLLGAEGEVLELIVLYLTVIFLFTPVNLLTMIGNSVYQGWGNTMLPMRFMLTGTLLNLLFDPILIFGWAVFPEMGIAGAAYATAIGRCVALTYMLVKLFVHHNPSKLNFRRFRPDRRIISGIFQVGLPSSAGQIMTSIAMAFIFFILDPFGPDAKAAYTIVFTYEMVVFLPAIGISQAVTIMTGHNFGARLYRRVDQVFRSGTVIAMGIMGVSAVIIALMPRVFAGIFARSPEVLDITATALQIVIPGSAFSSIYLTSVASFQGLGLGRQYLMANLLRLYLLQVPVAYAGARFFGLKGVWVGLMLINIASALILFFWHRYLFKYRILPGKLEPL